MSSFPIMRKASGYWIAYLQWMTQKLNFVWNVALWYWLFGRIFKICRDVVGWTELSTMTLIYVCNFLTYSTVWHPKIINCESKWKYYRVLCTYWIKGSWTLKLLAVKSTCINVTCEKCFRIHEGWEELVMLVKVSALFVDAHQQFAVGQYFHWREKSNMSERKKNLRVITTERKMEFEYFNQQYENSLNALITQSQRES